MDYYWTRGHTLGRGSTATVYTAEFHGSGELFAVKSAEVHRSEELRKEQGLLSSLNCPQIVKYKGYDVTYEDGRYFYNLFLEYAPRGTLLDVIAHYNHGGATMEHSLASVYTRQILLGLNYLHSNGIVHCDVKGQNVLITQHGAKIADFGCARKVGSGAGGRGGVIAGTPAFMAPEVARGDEQGFPADVWALGCTILEMVTGKPPWNDVSGDPVSVLYRVGFSGEAPEIPESVSEEVKDFLGKCLRSEASKRWTVKELLGHAFVAESRFVGIECDEHDLDTPTSVLEPQGLWNWHTNQDSPRGISSMNSPSARDRVLGLCGDDEPNWDLNNADDDKWITVRSNEDYSPVGIAQDFCSDNVRILREDDENVLVNFYEPPQDVVVICNVIHELSRWNDVVVVVGDSYLCRIIDCKCCIRDSVFLGCCSSCSSLNIYYYCCKKKEIYVTHGLLFNSTLDDMATLQFKFPILLQWNNNVFPIM
ncbi:mitogen-activated protein kinase kinase kinase 18-like [Arachis duranensis]|uniref:Mitogen-activated protein kinase kinase kinase 18-like n=1 Tax=Arachis duranensis TaxID=130453 RepID=A0A6P4CZE5_ARADU|nr:mitogen-activated protein kinase kinase kinase 18-like [Arachis duranensis]